MTRRSVNESFKWLAVNPKSPVFAERGGRTHYYTDCSQIIRNGCVAQELTQRQLYQFERYLCWTCVGRLVEAAERATAYPDEGGAGGSDAAGGSGGSVETGSGSVASGGRKG